MCKFCEKSGTKLMDLLVDQDGFMACLGPIGPIGKRKYPDMTGELHLNYNGFCTSIPIKYCPVCGKEINLCIM